VFKREARFSKIQPVPSVGTYESERADVEAFYNFWFSFESWRSFERMDEEDVDKSEGRDEKRWIEKKNKSQRQKLKKEDNVRTTKLVEQAFAADPRIRKFKADEKAAKEAKKAEKELASRAGEIEAAKKAEEEQVAREAVESQEKAAKEEEKKNREAAKKAVTKEKKTIRRMLRDNNNFLQADAKPEHTISQLEKLEFILDVYSFEQMEAFRIKLEAALPSGVESLLLAFDEEFMAAEAFKAAEAAPESAPAKVAKAEPAAAWTAAEAESLVKAVNSFPGGISGRWEKIAEVVGKSAKDCIAKSKLIHAAALAKRPAPAAVKPAAAKKEESAKPAAPAKKEVAAEGVPTMICPEKSDWTVKQQLQLEAGLKQFPASSFTGNPSERWVKIATVVPDKSVKQIKARMKALADCMKGKK
jgi:DnaJ homolog subfamily C member 2